jgi:hypothetical protein
MIIQNRMRQTAVLIPIAMMFLIFAVVWPRYLQPPASFGPGLIDGMHGAMYGVAFGIGLLPIILRMRRRRSDSEHKE